MSRSRKKAIVKDFGYRKAEYWKVHRRVNKCIINNHCKVNSHIHYDWQEPHLKLAKELINDYDYADWIWDAKYFWTDHPNKEKWKRK